MHYRCLSCRAKYVIPDARVAAAGADGLRVRCSRCRAIMAVSVPSPADDLPTSGTASTTREATGVFQNPFAHVALPSSLGVGGGEFGSREVTGVFLPLLSSFEAPREGSAHFWASISGRPRGPYTAKELVVLADKGKVRGGTLVWRPGASGWHPLKDVTDFDVSWLREAVARRKHREQEAEQEAFARRGIAPIRLERQTIRTSMPALPAAWDVALDDAPSALPHLLGGELTGSFEWRAPLPVPPSRSTGRGSAAAIATALIGSAAVVVVAVLLLWR